MQAMKKNRTNIKLTLGNHTILTVYIFMGISRYHVCLVDEVNYKVNTRTLVTSQGG